MILFGGGGGGQTREVAESIGRTESHCQSLIRRAGFSLIEVLLALAIFLLVSRVAIGRLVDMGVDRQIESRLKIRGARLAQSKMAEVVSGSQGQGQAPTSGSGTFDNDDSDFSWSVTADLQTPQNLYLS